MKTFNNLPPLNALEDLTLLDADQAAHYLGLSSGTLSVWRTTGRYNLKYIKVGRMVRYAAGDIKAFIERRTQTHTTKTQSTEI